MPECIFCDEPCEEGCEECPGCLKKPFPGMYFDPKTFMKKRPLGSRLGSNMTNKHMMVLDVASKGCLRSRTELSCWRPLRRNTR